MIASLCLCFLNLCVIWVVKPSGAEHFAKLVARDHFGLRFWS